MEQLKKQYIEDAEQELKVVESSSDVDMKNIINFDGSVFSKETADRKITEQVNSAESIEELVNMCKQIESIEDSVGVISGVELAERIEHVQNKTIYLENITRLYGLREKVLELLGDDVLSEELEEREKIEQLKQNILEEVEEIPFETLLAQGIALEQPGEEYEASKAQYEQAYKEHQSLIVNQPKGIKKLFSFFKNRSQLQESENNVNALKAEMEEKHRELQEFEELQEKIVPFEK